MLGEIETITADSSTLKFCCRTWIFSRLSFSNLNHLFTNMCGCREPRKFIFIFISRGDHRCVRKNENGLMCVDRWWWRQWKVVWESSRARRFCETCLTILNGDEWKYFRHRFTHWLFFSHVYLKQKLCVGSREHHEYLLFMRSVYNILNSFFSDQHSKLWHQHRALNWNNSFSGSNCCRKLKEKKRREKLFSSSNSSRAKM